MAQTRGKRTRTASRRVEGWIKPVEPEFETIQILRDDGSYDEASLPDLTDDQMKELYEWMVFARILDQRALNMQRQGRMGTYPPVGGQEAAQVGSAYALEKEDWLFPSYRESAAMMVHGMPPELTFLYWMGREEGAAAPEGVNVFTISIPIATQVPHAVGAAWAARLRGEKKAFLVYFGDGGTSEGDFHEGANFAGVFKAPVVLFCQNNHYAISVPLERQTASRTIAQKAVAYGFPGVRVDGNDVLAVYAVTREAVERARRGEGPTLIEAVTYRYGPHTTADDPTRYRTADEVKEWQERRDPIMRFRRFLESRGLWSEAQEEELQERLRERAAEVVRKAENYPKPEPTNMFDYMYAELPWNLKEQREALLQELAERGEAR
ncbi:MAG: pyruvate dehydrogenase (acetyl-transferring) E1 component subunit alpha [Thermaerobacter sp.]|nr:pyruvate dehydrogenase (acetyl-transferring) E1 component subunit alpha [Bacillota bacterium]REJ35251.1 MAG: pyruvate dehydrogenase (acetyl-transferring) E1 component subunit alpha [Bacillota bacterium]